MATEYSKTFLKEVLIRVDFASPVTKLVKALPERLRDLILPLFPISEPREFIGKDLLVSLGASEASKERTLRGTDWFLDIPVRRSRSSGE